MEYNYPYTTIHINNREVSLQQILESREQPLTAFEQNSFSFIREWFSDVGVFDLQTSGSTGNPKTITIRRDQFITSALLTQQALGLNQGDTAFVCLDTRYIAGKMMLIRSFAGGMKIVATEPRGNPFDGLNYPDRMDFAAFVPYQIATILSSHYHTRLNKFKKIIIGGAEIEYQVLDSLRRTISADCYATYGMTETISHIALKKLTGPSATDFFSTLPGISISTDSRGCLIIDAPHIGEELITNDIVVMHDDASFEWLGRFDNVINSGGVKISPEQLEKVIENVFLELNLHNRFVISSLPDPMLGSQVVLVIEQKWSDEALIKSLFEHLRAKLDAFLMPKKILVLPNFPQTDTGKINRHELKKMLSERPQN